LKIDAKDPRPAFARRLHSALSILIIAETVALLPLATLGLLAAGSWNGLIIMFAVDVCALPVTVVLVMIVIVIFGDGLVFPYPIPSREEQERFRHDLRGRSPMTDDEFYERFYAGSLHLKSLVCGVRSLLIEQFDRRVARCHPNECLFALIPIEGINDLISELEFALEFRSSDGVAGSGPADGPHPFIHTIDDWLRYVERHLKTPIDEIDSAHAWGNVRES
jgi:hypothetical protein